MLRSPPFKNRRQPSSPAVMPSGGMVLFSRLAGKVRRKISQYTRAAPARIPMGTSSGLPVRW